MGQPTANKSPKELTHRDADFECRLPAGWQDRHAVKHIPIVASEGRDRDNGAVDLGVEAPGNVRSGSIKRYSKSSVSPAHSADSPEERPSYNRFMIIEQIGEGHITFPLPSGPRVLHMAC